MFSADGQLLFLRQQDDLFNINKTEEKNLALIQTRHLS